jgi:hypothetical protein
MRTTAAGVPGRQPPRIRAVGVSYLSASFNGLRVASQVRDVSPASVVDVYGAEQLDVARPWLKVDLVAFLQTVRTPLGFRAMFAPGLD